jgi:hypothetical protein
MTITTRTATPNPTLDSAAPHVMPPTRNEPTDRRNRRVAALAIGGFAALAVVGTAAGITLATRSAPSAQAVTQYAAPTSSLPNDAAESAHGTGQGVQLFSGPATGTPAAESEPDPIEVAHGAGAWVRSTSGSTLR